MVTTLVAGVSVPLWDRELTRALNRAAEQGLSSDVSMWQCGVMNDQGQVYRYILAEGPKESVSVIACFDLRDFRLVVHEHRPVMCRKHRSNAPA